MGRQAAAKLNDEQEQALLAFLRKTADVALICVYAPTADGLFTQQFSPRGDYRWIYYLWNRAYSWTPRLIEHQDHVSIAHTANAPLIEYTRHNFEGAEPVGRIYWAKDFAAPDGLAYDFVSFDRWFNTVSGWLRRHGGAA